MRSGKFSRTSFFPLNKIQSTKTEIRNKFEIQMLQCSKPLKVYFPQRYCFCFCSLEFWSFDIVSNFDNQISNLMQ